MREGGALAEFVGTENKSEILDGIRIRLGVRLKTPFTLAGGQAAALGRIVSNPSAAVAEMQQLTSVRAWS